MPLVYCLYRETQNSGYDINQQRLACHLFASKHNWEISQEFFENKSSAIRMNFNTQDGLKRVHDDALFGEFDILLVFSTDCIGCRPSESPFVINYLLEQGVQVYSVQEGKQQINTDIQRLTILAHKLQLV